LAVGVSSVFINIHTHSAALRSANRKNFPVGPFPILAGEFLEEKKMEDLEHLFVVRVVEDKECLSVRREQMFALLSMSGSAGRVVGVHHPPAPGGLWHDMFNPCEFLVPA